MLFNSLDFAIFLPIVFILYWFVAAKNLKVQNGLLVLASYLFYGWWDWRFLSLILFSTLIDYSIGINLSKQNNLTKRKVLLWTSIIVNLGFLGFFKYYNFFLDNFVSAFSFFGSEIQVGSLDIVLPVGISFYTFQTLSYTIDVYKRKLEPTKDFIAFTAFVSFFPQLVAGPIERATNLLPQFYSFRRFKYHKAVDGLRQILWGLFKKVVIADTCAKYANEIFNNSESHSGVVLAFGAIFFAFQIYCDFSGYSDIAIGTSRLFGFDLKKNFSFPYFSRDIAEFWRRWHISLSTWFRDYLYIPIGGSRGGTWMKIRNTFIIFLVSGFWHGANWTFIVWGALNAIYFLPLLLFNKNRVNVNVVASNRVLPSFKEILLMTRTFGLSMIAWIFFRAESVTHALTYIWGVFSNLKSYCVIDFYLDYLEAFVLLIIFILIEWQGRKNEFGLSGKLIQGIKLKKYCIYYLLVISILWYSGSEQTFIYFQF